MSNTDYILTSNGNFVSKDELCHWGIKGMKWGVRRYQNEDGTLTPAGKKHLKEASSSTNENAYANSKTTVSEGKTPKESSPPDYLDMFDDEMQSGNKGVLYEYAKAQKAKWKSEGTDNEKAATEKLVASYAKLKADYLKRTASETALQFLKDNPKILTSNAELMKTDFSDPRRKEYIKYEVGFEGALDNLYETDSFYEYIERSQDELKHYGILGIKWGVRRYQNKDGTLTNLGRKRLAKEASAYYENEANKRLPAILTRSRQIDNEFGNTPDNDVAKIDKLLREQSANESVYRHLISRSIEIKKNSESGKRYVEEYANNIPIHQLMKAYSDEYAYYQYNYNGDKEWLLNWDEKTGPKFK